MKLLIRAGHTESQYWADLWRYRELFFVLAWRDVAIRYKQTVAGIAWAFLQPILTTIITTFVFGRLANLPAEGAPYPLMVFAAQLPWQFFSTSLTTSSQSLISNSNLISKVYFPRMIVPGGSVVTGLADFFVQCLLLVPLLAWYHFVPDARVLLLPVMILLACMTALGPGLLLTALMVRYRDFRIIVPFIVQFGFYLSPVAYSSSIISGKYQAFRLFYVLNPMVGVIEGFRWCLLRGASRISPLEFCDSILVGVFLLFLGVWYFRRTERTFADTI